MDWTPGDEDDVDDNVNDDDEDWNFETLKSVNERQSENYKKKNNEISTFISLLNNSCIENIK